MVRESILLDTVKAIRVGMLALIRPVITSTDGRWVAQQVDTRRTRFLRQASDQLFDLLANRHDQIGEFVDHHYDVRLFLQYRRRDVHAVGRLPERIRIGRPIASA